MFDQVQGVLRICIQLNDDDVELELEYSWQIVKLGIRRELTDRARAETQYSVCHGLSALLLRANQGDRQNVSTECVGIVRKDRH
jgi:hypothetical protein